MNKTQHIKSLSFGKATSKTQQRIPAWFWYYPDTKTTEELLFGSREDFVLEQSARLKYFVIDYVGRWSDKVIKYLPQQSTKWHIYLGFKEFYEHTKLRELAKKYGWYVMEFRRVEFRTKEGHVVRILGFGGTTIADRIVTIYAKPRESLSCVLHNVSELLLKIPRELGVIPKLLFIHKKIPGRKQEVIKNAKQ